MPLEKHYEGLGHRICEHFVVPALKASKNYDRLTSFFTTESLLACAEGIDDLWERRGAMRLVLGIHAVPEDLATAAASPQWVDRLVEQARLRVIAGCVRLTEEVARNRIGTLAMMMRDGFLQVKVAAPRNPDGLPTGGILHSKRYIFTDAHDNAVSAIGSPNETGKALSDNFEELEVHFSWDEPDRTHKLIQSFERIWRGERVDLEVRELGKDFATQLLKALNVVIERPKPERPSNAAHKVLILLRESPEFAFANVAKAALFPHQERALRDAASRWPIRVLLADEVGLGKTIEAGSMVSYANRFLGARRILILTPAGLRRQWQSELLTHFGIDSWRYESDRSIFIGPRDEERSAERGTPLNGAPDVVIVSWQLARGPWQDRGVFEHSTWKPDLILVDEAHSARRTRGTDKKFKTTLVWKMIQKLGAGCPHLVLLTATPMQIQIEEYHGLLMLLGMPEWWLDADKFIALLANIERFKPQNELAPTKQVAEGISHGLSMHAVPELCLHHEQTLSLEALFPLPLSIPKAVALMDKGDILRNLAILASPPAVLTVRNTRRGLESVGYKFPKRHFFAPPLALDKSGTNFLRRISTFLDVAYGKVELALGITNAGVNGFIHSGYQQRLVSSLFSAQRTLMNRATKLEALLKTGRWNGDNISDDELDDDASDSRKRPAADYARLESAKQHARIELQYIKEMRQNLADSIASGGDPKLAKLKEIIVNGLEAGDSLLVFSRFTDTVDACIDAVGDSVLSGGDGYGKYVGGESWICIRGERVKTDKAGLCDALRRGRIKVVFCSDAASEGLNLQAARRLVNVDVPWNPARLEQRIGRIARLGQRAVEVEITNLWYPGTVEEQMYTRLLARQELYSLAVGEFPDVVGESIRAQIRPDQPLDFGAAEHRLNELRFKAEMIALQRVWAEKKSGEDSVGGEFRKALFSLVKKLLSAKAWPVKESGPALSFDLDGEEVTVDSSAGQEDSLTVQHSAIKALLQTAQTIPEGAADGLAVLCTGGRPISLLFKAGFQYHVLGPTETLVALEAVLLGGVEISLSGPALSAEPSRGEVVAALREAFPGRIEIGAIKVPFRGKAPEQSPLEGAIQIIPLDAWNPHPCEKM